MRTCSSGLHVTARMHLTDRPCRRAFLGPGPAAQSAKLRVWPCSSNEKNGSPCVPIEQYQVVNRVSSSLRYSPISACRKVTMPVGSSFLASAVDRALTPKPCTLVSLLSSYLSLSIYSPMACQSWTGLPLPGAPGSLRSTFPRVPSTHCLHTKTASRRLALPTPCIARAVQ